MERPKLEVADIVRRYGEAYRQQHALSSHEQRALDAIATCRTAALGGHVEQCDHCHHQRIAYDSCRHRCCPKCQSLARAVWVEQRQAELLECEHFHVVFTLPQPIAAIAFHNKAVLYNLLFEVTAETVRTIAADPKHLGAEVGVLAVLHTWGQNLMFHPHLHCIIPGGGLSLDGTRWVGCRRGFFLPVRVLSRFFRRRFLGRLVQLFDTGRLRFVADLEPLGERDAFQRYLEPLRRKEWVVYAKRPLAGPRQILNYLGRYTHRVAISNHRLLDIDEGKVRFRWRDYRDNNRQKVMTVTADEFIRRFLMHILPLGLQRIRYYGLFANRYRKDKLARCRKLLGMTVDSTTPQPLAACTDYRERYEALTGISLTQCPQCRTGRMKAVERLEPRAIPPPFIDTS